MKRYVCSLLALCILLAMLSASATADAVVKHSLYIGTADKDTLQQEIPYDEAKAIILEICRTHQVDGITLLESEGLWLDEEGNLVTEPSFVLVFLNCAMEKVEAIGTDICEALNQSTILLETSYVSLALLTADR